MLNPRLGRYYIRLDRNLWPVLGSLILRKNKPTGGRWLDITDCIDVCGCFTTTTTTTTSSTTTTTTTEA